MHVFIVVVIVKANPMELTTSLAPGTKDCSSTAESWLIEVVEARAVTRADSSVTVEYGYLHYAWIGLTEKARPRRLHELS